ncbi:MAG TPA: helix-turn-helix transcriptional regulator [Tepidisphaeraceae bacterium]
MKQRINARGHIYCFNCKQYLPGERFTFAHYPSWNKSRYWSSCRECTNELDRLRWSGKRRADNNQQRLVRQRREHASARLERTRFVAGAILLLRKRGLTKTEIAQLADVSLSSILDWERHLRRVTPAVAKRFGVLLSETRHLPTGKEPCYRRRLPHPELGDLLQRCRPQVRAFPVRSRWKVAA